MFTLRDYQLETVDCIERELQKVRSTCIVQATGLGKTTIASEIIRRWHPKRTMFVCQGKEILKQAALRIEQHTGIRPDIERGEWHASRDTNRPVVAMIQSLNSKWGETGRRMHKFRPSLVIVDEFHHSAAESYERLFNYLPPETKLLGMSATPKRLDGKALGKYFETVAHTMELKEAIDKGWLCDIAQEYIMVDELDLSKVRTVRGDLDVNELKAQVEPEKMVQRMVMPSLEIVFGVDRKSLLALPPDKWEEHLKTNGHQPFRTIMFCVSVAQAKLASEVFNRAVPKMSRFVFGETPTEERDETMTDFRAGVFPVLCNCQVLGEGVDVPEVEVILQARPTKSLALWIQQLGRGTRTTPGTLDGLNTVEERKTAIAASKKRFVRVVDFVGNHGRHKLISSIDVLGGEMSDDVKRMAMDAAIKKGKPVAIAVTLTNAERQRERELKEAKQRALEYAKRNLVAGVDYHSKKVNPFQHDHGQLDVWEKKDTQLGCTLRQAKALGRNGFNPRKVNFKQAQWIIGILAKNKWTLPTEFEWMRKKFGGPV